MHMSEFRLESFEPEVESVVDHDDDDDHAQDENNDDASDRARVRSSVLSRIGSRRIFSTRTIRLRWASCYH